MACCNEFKTECLKVVTIGYLKTFIGDNIQDANGNTVHVPSSYSSGYCPTYSELTGGTILPKRTSGATPNGDVDGILVGGSYSGTQLVRQEDLSLGYTRIKSLSLSASKTIISECGGSSVLSFSQRYERTNKYMESTCTVASSSTEVTSSDALSVTYTSSNPAFTFSSHSTVTVGRQTSTNGEAPARSTVITGTAMFKGEPKTGVVTITQNALTGTYEFWYTAHTISNKHVVCDGSTFGRTGGTYGAQALHDEIKWDVYRWKDSCGTVYDTRTEDRNKTSYKDVLYDSYSGKFAPCDSICECWTTGNNGGGPSGWAPQTGGTRIAIGTYGWDKCATSEMPQAIYEKGYDDGGNYCSNFSFEGGTIYANLTPNNGAEQRYSVYTFSKGKGSSCDDYFTVVQNGTANTQVCNTSNTGTKLPATTGSAETIVATFNCGYGSYCNNVDIYFKNGRDVAKDFRFDGTNIYAKVKSNNTGADRNGNYWVIVRDNSGNTLCKNIITAYQQGNPTPSDKRTDSISWEGYGGCSWEQTCIGCSINGASSLTCSGTTQFTVDEG